MASRGERDAAWLTLLRAPGIGPAELRERISKDGDAVTALAAACRDTALPTATRAWLEAPDSDAIAADLAWLAADDHHLVGCGDAEFPALLAEAPSPPAALFVAGSVDALWQPQLAIVGSRSASASGLATARKFARALAQAGLTITSGLADGIDGAAHAAALDAGGATVAVLGTGPDQVYPSRNAALAERIFGHGALVSEFPPGTPPRPDHFPRRNRIIAGLALGTLVVEASLRSGSLITARLASEAGRDVYAIPGSINNPLARGCHRLIRDGAHLVETTDEVLAEVAPLAARLGAELRSRLAAAGPDDAPEPSAGLGTRARDPDYRKLLAALGADPAGIDTLAERTGLPVPALSSMLLVLELDGAIDAAPGGTWVRRYS